MRSLIDVGKDQSNPGAQQCQEPDRPDRAQGSDGRCYTEQHKPNDASQDDGQRPSRRRLEPDDQGPECFRIDQADKSFNREDGAENLYDCSR